MIGGWLIIILVVALTLLHQSLSAKGLGSGIETSYGAPYLSPGYEWNGGSIRPLREIAS